MAEGRKLWHWAVLALLSVIWGTSYILMKKGLESFSSFQIAYLRVFFTFLSLLPVAIKNLPKLNRNNIISILIIGFCGSGIPAYLFPLAETRMDSSMAGMLNSLSPVFTLIVGIQFYKRQAIKAQIAGIMIGLAGALCLLYSDTVSFNFYGLYVVLATFLYGISGNEVSRVKEMNGLQITALAFFVMSPFAITGLLFSDLHSAMETENWIANLGFIAILAVAGSAFALALYYLLIKDTSPVFASMVTYFIPIIATLWGIADGEPFTLMIFISVIIIFTGVYLIYRPDFVRKIYNYFR